MTTVFVVASVTVLGMLAALVVLRVADRLAPPETISPVREWEPGPREEVKIEFSCGCVQKVNVPTRDVRSGIMPVRCICKDRGYPVAYTRGGKHARSERIVSSA